MPVISAEYVRLLKTGGNKARAVLKASYDHCSDGTVSLPLQAYLQGRTRIERIPPDDLPSERVLRGTKKHSAPCAS